MYRFMPTIVILSGFGFVSPAIGDVVVSNVYDNLQADRALKNVPVTLSREGRPVHVRGRFQSSGRPVAVTTKTMIRCAGPPILARSVLHAKSLLILGGGEHPCERATLVELALPELTVSSVNHPGQCPA